MSNFFAIIRKSVAVVLFVLGGMYVVNIGVYFVKLQSNQPFPGSFGIGSLIGAVVALPIAWALWTYGGSKPSVKAIDRSDRIDPKFQAGV